MCIMAMEPPPPNTYIHTHIKIPSIKIFSINIVIINPYTVGHKCSTNLPSPHTCRRNYEVACYTL